MAKSNYLLQPTIKRGLGTLLLATLFIGSQVGASEQTLRFSSGKEQTQLIELYTSQGCSSCPPAESWLGSLKNDPRLWSKIVPVAFHVTYWDYLGWKDQFGSDAFSQRQVRHRRLGNIGSVYTPGLVVDGKEWRGWFRGGRLPVSTSQTEELSLELNGQQLNARYPNRSLTPLVLNLALLGVDIESEIEAGENSGKRLPQDFVVLEHQQLKSTDGTWHTQMNLSRKVTGRLAIAAWITPAGSQTPLQATGGWITF